MMKERIAIFLIFISIGIGAQTKEDKKALKEQEKLQKEIKQEAQAKVTEALVHSKRFVLEADRVRDKYGRSYFVQSLLNFILLDSAEATLQLGNPTGIGYNGVGGVTIDGNITEYEIDYREKTKSFTIEISISSPVGTYNVVMYIAANGNAEATVRGATTSGSLTYSGEIVPLSASNVYKGSAI